MPLRVSKRKTEDATALLTGLQIGLQAILDASSESEELLKADPQRQLTGAQQSEVLHAIEQQTIALGHRYRACMAALKRQQRRQDMNTICESF